MSRREFTLEESKKRNAESNRRSKERNKDKYNARARAIYKRNKSGRILEYINIPKKDIPGHEGRYAISRGGLIWQYEKTWYVSPGKILIQPAGFRRSGRIRKHGYFTTSIDGKSTYVHRLLALTYIPNPLKLPQINHINGAKNDNRLQNLEWCTASQNIKHSVDTGLVRIVRGSENGKSKLTEHDVLSIKEKLRKRDLSLTEIASQYDVTLTTIYSIREGITWRHVQSSD